MIRGGPERGAGASAWPTGDRALLSKAVLGSDADLATTFATWRDLVDFEGTLDGGSFRLLPLLFTRLQAIGCRDPLMTRLKGVYRQAWCETHNLFNDLGPVIAALREAGVPTMMLKGAPLALAYYRSHATRPMHDLDVAIPASSADVARATMCRLGWRLASHHTAHTTPEAHALGFVDGAGREIDLHLHPMRETPYAAADDWFWRSSRPFDFGGVATRQPSPTAMLLHVILHGVRSNYEPPVRWIVDAATVLDTARGEIDWDELVRFARAHKVAHRLHLGLSYLARAHDVAIPAPVLDALNRAGVSLIERIENLVYLGPPSRLYQDRLFAALDYWRFLRDQNGWSFAKRYPAYLQRRWGLHHPLQAPLVAIAWIARRAFSPRPARGAPGGGPHV